MTSKLRRAGAACVEAGRWLATCEILRDQVRRIDKADSPEERARLALAIIEKSRTWMPMYEENAASTGREADRLISELEHPGAALARRLVATVRGARRAWRGTR